MKLYHVSTNMAHDGVFTPGIPHYRMSDEDATIPRICVSDSVDGCLSAMPKRDNDFGELVYENSGFFKVFVFDTDELSLTANDVVTSEHLYQNDLVEDAEHTGEHWITVPVKATNQYTLYVLNWEEDAVDSYPYEVERRLEEDEELDLEEAFHELYPERGDIGFTTQITLTEWKEDWIEEGEVFDPQYFTGDTIFYKEVKQGHIPELAYRDGLGYVAKQLLPLDQLRDLMMTSTTH